MPVYFSEKCADYEMIVWQIAEPIDFFLQQKIGWNENLLHQIKSEERKIQHVISRFVAAEILQTNDVSCVYNDENRKPFLKNSIQKISISHDENWVAVIISNKNVGIDIFCSNPRVLSIAKRFMHYDEMRLLEKYFTNEQEKINWLSKIWCVKETVFKWMNKESVEFKTDIKVQAINENEISVLTKFFGEVNVQTKFESDFYLSWLA